MLSHNRIFLFNAEPLASDDYKNSLTRGEHFRQLVIHSNASTCWWRLRDVFSIKVVRTEVKFIYFLKKEKKNT